MSPFTSKNTPYCGATSVVLDAAGFYNLFKTFFHIFQSALDEATEPWGIKVERVEM